MFTLRKLVHNIINNQIKINNCCNFQNYIRFFSSTSGILNSGFPDVDIPNVPVNEFVFENIGKWENLIAAVSNFFFTVSLDIWSEFGFRFCVYYNIPWLAIFNRTIFLLNYLTLQFYNLSWVLLDWIIHCPFLQIALMTVSPSTCPFRGSVAR